jgi:hypothetical protein
MSFQLTFLGYYSIKSPQLKKQTHSVKKRNWSHRERTAQADGPRWTAEVDGNCGRPLADGAAVRRRRTALEDGRQGERPWDRRTQPWTSGRVTTLRMAVLRLSRRWRDRRLPQVRTGSNPFTMHWVRCRQSMTGRESCLGKLANLRYARHQSFRIGSGR